MTNIAFGSKYFIFSKFSTFPRTSTLEANRANLLKELDELNTFAGSRELKDFNELGKYLESKECKETAAAIQSSKKKETDKISSYETRKKSKPFKDYFKFKDSPKLKQYQAFSGSNELKDYEELEKLVTSKKFEDEKKGLEEKKAGEEKKLTEFNALKKSKAIRNYLRFMESDKLKNFQQAEKSAELKKFQELEKHIGSKEFQNTKSKEALKSFKDTPEGKKEAEFEQLKKSGLIRNYFKFRDSKSYKDYLAFEKSNDLKKYHELDGYINSKEHKELLTSSTSELAKLNEKLNSYLSKKKSRPIKEFYAFGKLPKYTAFVAFDKSKELADYQAMGKYLNSDEHKNLMKTLEVKEANEKEKQSKYDSFRNSKKYKWFLGIKDSNEFDEIKKVKLVFEDDFKDSKLDKNKWMTRYFWGDKLINDAYALETDKAFPTDGKNLEIHDSILKIITRAEKTTGKMWKQPYGFIPQEFGYSTGLISTAKSHRQKFGKIEARIKINYSRPVHNHFWMASEMNLPHVDILKQIGKKTKVDMANVYGSATGNIGPDKKTAKFSGLDISQDFFIYTLEWTKSKLVWKINDVVVNEQTQGVPQEEMYVVFSSGITGNISRDQFPVSMDIDWVRCYTFV
ncbi:MAG: glycoside hydrolase family 16 protein [Bacteroidetes bacterium]|nr:glycoside hydrolase family 16 protein [Bacteroidota bacterium]